MFSTMSCFLRPDDVHDVASFDVSTTIFCDGGGRVEPFGKRTREELLEIVLVMADEFDQAADEYKRDAITQIEGVEGGTIADMNEAIHRVVHAVAFMRLARQLREVVGIAEGRRNGERWASAPRELAEDPEEC